MSVMMSVPPPLMFVLVGGMFVCCKYGGHCSSISSSEAGETTPTSLNLSPWHWESFVPARILQPQHHMGGVLVWCVGVVCWCGVLVWCVGVCVAVVGKVGLTCHQGGLAVGEPVGEFKPADEPTVYMHRNDKMH